MILWGVKMKHFKKHNYLNYKFLINGYSEFRLYPFMPQNNEFEKGLKYRLCEFWYNPETDTDRIIELCRVSSIKEAEFYIFETLKRK